MIPFKYEDYVSERIKTHIDSEVERLLPDLKRLINLFQRANWGEGIHEYSPRVEFVVDIGSLQKLDKMRNHVFSLMFDSDQKDETLIYVLLLADDISWEIIGKAKIENEDWFPKQGEKNESI